MLKGCIGIIERRGMRNLFIVIIPVVLFVAMVTTIMSYAPLRQERAEFSSIEKRIEFVKEQIARMKENLVGLEGHNKLLQQKISESENQIDVYNKQLSGLKDKKAQLIIKLQDRHKQLMRLKEELENLTGLKGTLKSAIDGIMARRQRTNSEIIKLGAAKRQLEKGIKKYMEPKKEAEFEKTIIKLSEVSEGSVLEVNEKCGFAIIDIGTEAGIIVGDILNVYRDEELVSQVVVDKVFKDMSSVVPAEGFTLVELQATDKVRLKEMNAR